MIDLNYAAYNENAQQYIDHNKEGATGGLTPVARVKRFQNFMVSGRVLEIGSGEGLDAIALRQAGYTVIASDFVASFINRLRSKGLPTIAFDAKRDAIPADLQPLDGVYANAVFVHFNPNDFIESLQKIRVALTPNGIIFCSVILGEGSEIAGRAKGIEREFFYYNPQSIEPILAESGFAIDLLEYPIDGKWLHVIAHRAR